MGPLQKNKLSKVSSTKSGILMTLTNLALSIRKKLRNSFKTPSVTSDQVMSSPKRPSMRFSKPSTRTTQEQLRKPRWLSSSSNSLEETERSAGLAQKAQAIETRLGA